MPKLMLKFEAAFIREIKLDKPSFSLGRKADNDVVLDNAAVSGHHCKMYESGGTWFVEDLNSTNGTFINGKKTLKAGLKNGDTINLVKFSLVFMDEAAATKAPEPPLPAQRPKTPLGALEVLENPADTRKEFDLTALSTYVGKSSQAAIPYKSAGLFGGGPELAVVITMRPEGYYLNPIKEDYAKYNGNPLTEKVVLKDDDTIEVGATRFRFFLKK
ncbi:MAG: FHA domain-containing protein [Elusimicrobiota bacterium]|nr:FHA domain-containing protein [Elusimicrobiota bacterium]